MILKKIQQYIVRRLFSEKVLKKPDGTKPSLTSQSLKVAKHSIKPTGRVLPAIFMRYT